MTTKFEWVLPAAIYLLALLSIAAGIPKIQRMPQELEFLAALGLSGLVVSALGIIQCIGGVLLFSTRFRLIGAVMAGTGLLISGIALLVGGNTPFGLVSFLPLAALVMVIFLEHRRG